MSVNIATQTAPQNQPNQKSVIVSQTAIQPANDFQPKTNNSLRDTLAISDNTQLMNRLRTILDEVPIVDSQHVDSIKLALANGSYQFNDANVAEQMIQSEAAFRN